MKAVIFDVVSVLIGWRPRLIYQKYIRDPELEKWFLDEVRRALLEDKPFREIPFAEGLQLAGQSGSMGISQP